MSYLLNHQLLVLKYQISYVDEDLLSFDMCNSFYFHPVNNQILNSTYGSYVFFPMLPIWLPGVELYIIKVSLILVGVWVTTNR